MTDGKHVSLIILSLGLKTTPQTNQMRLILAGGGGSWQQFRRTACSTPTQSGYFYLYYRPRFGLYFPDSGPLQLLTLKAGLKVELSSRRMMRIQGQSTLTPKEETIAT